MNDKENNLDIPDGFNPNIKNNELEKKYRNQENNNSYVDNFLNDNTKRIIDKNIEEKNKENQLFYDESNTIDIAAAFWEENNVLDKLFSSIGTYYDYEKDNMWDKKEGKKLIDEADYLSLSQKDDILQNYNISEKTLKSRLQKYKNEYNNNILIQKNYDKNFWTSLGATMVSASIDPTMAGFEIGSYNLAVNLTKHSGIGKKLLAHSIGSGLASGANESLLYANSEYKDFETVLYSTALGSILGGPIGAYTRKAKLSTHEDILEEADNFKFNSNYSKSKSNKRNNLIDEKDDEIINNVGDKIRIIDNEGNIKFITKEEYNKIPNKDKDFLKNTNIDELNKEKHSEGYNTPYVNIRFDNYANMIRGVKNDLEYQNIIKKFFKDPLTGLKGEGQDITPDEIIKNSQQKARGEIGSIIKINEDYFKSLGYKNTDEIGEYLEELAYKVRNKEIDYQSLSKEEKNIFETFKKYDDDLIKQYKKAGYEIKKDDDYIYSTRSYSASKMKIMFQKYNQKEIEDFFTESLVSGWRKLGKNIDKEFQTIAKLVSKKMVKNIESLNYGTKVYNKAQNIKIDENLNEVLNKLNNKKILSDEELELVKQIKYDIENVIDNSPNISKSKIKFDENFEKKMSDGEIFRFKDVTENNFIYKQLKNYEENIAEATFRQHSKITYKNKEFDLSNDLDLSRFEELIKKNKNSSNYKKFLENINSLKSGRIKEKMYGNGIPNQIGRIFRNTATGLLMNQIFFSAFPELFQSIVYTGFVNSYKNIKILRQLKKNMLSGKLTKEEKDYLDFIGYKLQSGKLELSKTKIFQEGDINYSSTTNEKIKNTLDILDDYSDRMAEFAINKVGHLNSLDSLSKETAFFGYLTKWKKLAYDSKNYELFVTNARKFDSGLNDEEINGILNFFKKEVNKEDSIVDIISKMKTNMDIKLQDKFIYSSSRKISSIINDPSIGESINIFNDNFFFKLFGQYLGYVSTSFAKLTLTGLKHKDIETYTLLLTGFVGSLLSQYARIYVNNVGTDKLEKETNIKKMAYRSLSNTPLLSFPIYAVQTGFTAAGIDLVSGRASGLKTDLFSSPSINIAKEVAKTPSKIYNKLTNDKKKKKGEANALNDLRKFVPNYIGMKQLFEYIGKN